MCQARRCIVMVPQNLFNSLPTNKILHLTELKGLAEDKKNVTKKIVICLLGRIENIVGKGENAGNLSL